MMPAYQPIARRYRPQTFADVIGQKAIIQTLTNALSAGTIGQAYLFCGTRGTGKTSIARILAKALNCTHPQGIEPCNQCSSCQDITASRSLDVIEIDGASNRGIDDAKNITETTIYTPALGKYKIYIIDEVHMLTKEAFNALLKTLEEPPKAVKFFFATTEPGKVPATIISRCQRFDLQRIAPIQLKEKLHKICQDMGKEIEEGALELIVELAEGSLRDAQSLLDRVLCYDKAITKDIATELLGLLPLSLLTSLDDAVSKGDISFAFSCSEEIFQRGKEYAELIDELMHHYKNHLQKVLKGKGSPIYTSDELLYILDLLFGIKQNIKRISRSHLEILLTKIIRCKHRIRPEALLKQMIEKKSVPSSSKIESPTKEISSPKEATEAKETPNKELVSIPFSVEKKTEAAPKIEAKEKSSPVATKEEVPSTEAALSLEKAHLETMLRFASVELEGTLVIPPQSE